MILAATALEISIPVVVVLQVIVALLLILLVMMQKPKQEGLGAAFGGGTAGEVFGARTTDVLQKGTIYLGVAFFALTMLLAVLTTARNKEVGKIEVKADPVPEAPAAPEPAAVVPTPAAPDAGEATEEDAAPAANGSEEEATEEEEAPAEEEAEEAPAEPAEPAVPAPAPAQD